MDKLMRHRAILVVMIILFLWSASIPALPETPDSIRTIRQAKELFHNNLVSDKNLSRSIMALDFIAATEKSDTVVKYGAQALNRYAWLLVGKDAGDASLPLFRRVLDYCSAEDSVLYYDALSGIGGVYLAKGDTNRAIDIAKKSMRYHASVNDTLGLLKAYANMATLYLNNTRPAAAKPFALKALELADKVGLYEYQSYILVILSRLETDFDAKERWLAKSDSIISANDLTQMGAENYLLRAEMAFSKGEYDKALKYADQCVTIATNYGQESYIVNALKLKARALGSLNDWAQAYFFLNLADEKEGAARAENEAYMASRAQFASSLMEWCDTHIVKSRGHYVTKSHSDLIRATVIGIVVVVGLLLLWWWRRRVRRKREESTVARIEGLTGEIESLKENNDSLVRKVKYLMFFYNNQNVLLNKIKTMAKGGLAKESEAIPSLRKINGFVASNMLDPIQDHHTAQFDEENEQFLQRLTTAFPEVTETEKCLATYIRAGLSTREICIITGNLPRSVNMTRHRLRQNMQLGEEENLDQFLKNL